MTKHRIENIGNAAARKSSNNNNNNAAASKEINITSDDNDDEDSNDENSRTSGEMYGETTTAADSNYFFLHGSLISQYGNVETHSAGSFVTRHSMEMKFSYCHDRCVLKKIAYITFNLSKVLCNVKYKDPMR